MNSTKKGIPSVKEERDILHAFLDLDKPEPFIKRYSYFIASTVRSTLIKSHFPFNENDIKDQTNEVFEDLLKNNKRKLRTYDESKSRLYRWINRIAFQITLKYMMKKGFDSPKSEQNRDVIDEKVISIADKFPIADEQLEQLEEEEIKRLKFESVMSIIHSKTISDRDKLVIQLHYFEGVKLIDIANTFGISDSNIYSIHKRAIDKIRKKFEKLFKQINKMNLSE